MDRQETQQTPQTPQTLQSLLASVSRSFYLTLRVLPGPVRGPIGLAYLLARATDTIADTASIPVAERLTHLQRLADCIPGKNNPAALAEIAASLGPRQTDPAEKILLAQLPAIFSAFETLEPADQQDIREVLSHIIRGQRQDLEYFSDSLRALPDNAALDEYTWLVAGCVGAFWTKICLRKLPDYARLSPDAPSTLATLGIDFGKGLQLVNILRDLRPDVANGRCYLPFDAETLATLWESPTGPLVFAQWLERAELLLDHGWQYVLSLRGWRLRFACALPILIGLRTLALLKERTPWQTPDRIKVSRAEIRSLLCQTAWRASSNHWLDALRASLQK